MGKKVFGIGMPKTGTSSLHTALEILGIKSIHYPHDEKTVRELEAGNYRLSLLDEYDALCDVPIPAIFAQLDECWPDSKFILTVRDQEEWLDSCENWFKRIQTSKRLSEIQKQIRINQLKIRNINFKGY